MKNNKEKMKKVLDYIIERKDDRARAELKKIIQNHPKYVDYKKQLKEYGMDFKIVDVDEKIYEDLKNVLEDFPKQVKLKILDETWKLIKNEN